jgi:hypothetical protein
MSASAQQTEFTTAVATGWTQMDVSPLTPRSFVEIINNDGTQGVGLIFTSGAAPTSQAWNTGEILLAGDKGAIAPASATIKVYVKTQTGAQVSGAALILREWS